VDRGVSGKKKQVIAVALVSLVLHGGQIRYFLPGELRSGETVQCVASGHAVHATVPARAVATDTWTKGGPSLQIDRRANGAVKVFCGTPTPARPPRSTLPYVIGPNGLALIRGANTLSKLEQIYGKPGKTRPCGASWSSIGLDVAFSFPKCTILRTATVRGPRWASLSGVHVGDSVAKMVWTTQTRSHPVGGRIYVIGTGAQYRAELVAFTGSNGAVAGFTATLRRPPSR
jgi:hypothetical protein